MANMTIDLLPEERRSIVTSFTFIVQNGEVIIVENWSEKDETWGKGVKVSMPTRVWSMGMRFVETVLSKGGDQWDQR